MAISAEEASDVLRTAFLPLRCGVEVYDYNQKIKFRVFGPGDQPLLSMSDLTSDDYFSAERLTAIINRAREDLVTYKKVALDPWQLTLRDAT